MWLEIGMRKYLRIFCVVNLLLFWSAFFCVTILGGLLYFVGLSHNVLLSQILLHKIESAGIDDTLARTARKTCRCCRLLLLGLLGLLRQQDRQAADHIQRLACCCGFRCLLSG
jgi:hypothetical protein